MDLIAESCLCDETWEHLQENWKWPFGFTPCPDEDKVLQLTREETRSDGTTKIIIDVDRLKFVLLNPEYKEYLVSVFAIAGPFRSGKSFFQNLLGSYLRRKNNGNGDGCSARDIETFFEAKGGRKPHTQGIHILREPFILKTEIAGESKKVAVFLVDTQGLFDLEASIEKITVIGTLSIAISSLQCFNVKTQIDRIHLEYIYKFAEKAVDIKEIDEESSFIEKESLMFIIRDWICDEEDTEDEYPYGFGGGSKYFNESVNPPQSKQAKEHKMMSEYLESTFGTILCCLLPHPGEAVRKTNVKKEQDLEEEFQDHIKYLFDHITHPDKLHVKKIGGQHATCAELCNRMKAFASMLEQDKALEDVKSIIQADFESRMSSIATTCANNFLAEIEKSAEKFRTQLEDDVAFDLESMRINALEEYDEKRKPGNEEFRQGWRKDYQKIIKQISNGFENCARAEKRYVELIKEFNEWRKEKASPASIDDDSFKRLAQKKKEELLAKFKNSITNKDLFDQCEVYFKNDVNKLIAETEDEVKKYLASLEKSWWKTALVMGTLVVGCAAAAAGAAAAAPVVLGAVAVDAAIGTGTAATVGAGFGSTAAAGYGANAAYSNYKLQHETGIIKPEETDEELALTKYEKSVIHVKLCFGHVQIRLSSKVKLR